MWYPDPVIARLQHDRQLRTLYGCLFLSAVLHGLAMFSLPASRAVSRPDEARVLTALFESRSPTAAAPAPRRPRERSAEVPAPVPPLSKPVDPAPVAAPRAEEPAQAAEQPASPPPVASSAAHAPAEAPARLPESLDTSLFDAYRLALINAAKRFKRYPGQAMDRGWEGRVEIRLVVDANGAIKSALVKTSSRYQVLDEQALKMVRQAFDVQPAPRGREFTVDVPVVFELQTG